MSFVQDLASKYVSVSKLRVRAVVADHVTVTSTATLPSGTLTACTDDDVYVNKTIDSADNTLTIDGADISGDLTVDSVTATNRVDGVNIPTGTLAELGETQTLLNKTISSTANTVTINSLTADSLVVVGAVTADSAVADSIALQTADYLTIGDHHQRFESKHDFTLLNASTWGLNFTNGDGFSHGLAAQYLGRFEAGQSVHLRIQMQDNVIMTVTTLLLHVTSSAVRIVRMDCSDTETLEPTVRVYSRLTGSVSDIWLDYYGSSTSQIISYVVGDCFSYSTGDTNYYLHSPDPQVADTLVSEHVTDWLTNISHFSNSNAVVAVNYDLSASPAPIVGNTVYGDLYVVGNVTVSGTTPSGAITDTITNKTITDASNTLTVSAADVATTSDLVVDSIVASTSISIGTMGLDPITSAHGMIAYDGGLDDQFIGGFTMNTTTAYFLDQASSIYENNCVCSVDDRITISYAGTYRVKMSVSMTPNETTENPEKQLWGVYLNNASAEGSHINGSGCIFKSMTNFITIQGSCEFLVALAATDFLRVGGVVIAGTVTTRIPNWSLSVERMYSTI